MNKLPLGRDSRDAQDCRKTSAFRQHVERHSGPTGHMQPGEFRRSQNCIGGTRPGNAAYVPPADLVLDLMSALERFIHTEAPNMLTLVKAGVVHVQFETIPPFLNGNGRLGRLPITLLLCPSSIVREPIL